MRRLLPLLCLLPLAAAEPLPPSPSDHPGLPLPVLPALTHWPAVVYADEARSVAFSASGPAGTPGSFAWEGAAPLPFALPGGGDAGGLAPLPMAPGTHRGRIQAGAVAVPVAIRLEDARGPWPLAALRDGHPVDAEGVPVVLLDRRRDADQERRLALVRRDPPRGEDPALVVGDPLEALGAGPWDGLPARCVPAVDPVLPHHAALVAIATALNPVPAGGAGLRPRTLMWCPGNAALAAGRWDGDEERVLGAVRSRCEGLGLRPRLVLALPPLPLDDREQAEERRELLRRSAGQLGWVVIDLARAAGGPEAANRVGDGVFAVHPVGEARERMRRILVAELER